MMRTLCVIFGFVLALSPFLLNRLDSGSDLNDHQLAMLNGGDPNFYKNNGRCDGGGGSAPTGGYVGCTAIGAACSQCVNPQANADGTYSAAMYDYTSRQTPYGIGVEYKQPADVPLQSCGSRLNGTCVVDNTSPSTFRCVGTPGDPCATKAAVGPQPLTCPPNAQGVSPNCIAPIDPSG